MDRRVKAIAIILVVIVSVVGVFFITRTTFHYERRYPSGEIRYVSLRIEDFETTPTEVRIRFIDNPSLMYSINIQQDDPGNHHMVSIQKFERSYSLEVQGTSFGDRTSLVDIILGTGTYYQIGIHGSLLGVTVTYDNGAIIDGNWLHLSCSNSTFDFTFTENVNFTDSGFEVRTVGEIDVVLDIDLPDGMNGYLTIPPGVSSYFPTMIGWYQETYPTGEKTIKTESIEEPLLELSHENPGAISGTLRS
jgi:hypothetical protein